MKRRVIVLVLLLVGSTVGLAMAQLAQGNFNAATGFSGRHGFTCTSCHTVPDAGAAGGMVAPPAHVVVEGVPSDWVPEQSYRITIRVEGGPPALPNPAPQGGFEIEASQGHFTAPDDMAELIDVYAEGAVTYTVAGTQVRQWAVNWHAPAITQSPAPVQFWVAAMAANGNHVIAAGLSDLGELGDQVDNVTITSPPSQAALDQWDAIRLEAPEIVESTFAGPYAPFQITGRHTDPAANALGVRINDGPWETIRTPNAEWVVGFSALPPGDHIISFRSETDDRTSEPVAYSFTAEGEAASQGAPFPFMLTLAAFALWRRP